MPGSNSRSPSPVAAPPIAAAPGPRAANLMKLYHDAVSHTLKTCNYPNFAACFPTPAEKVPDSMETLHKEFVDRLGEQCREHFDAILEERKVVPALNDLDRLIDEARKRKAKAEEQANGGPVQAPIPPHTLPANSLYLSHLSPAMSEHEANLTSQLEALQSQNASLVTTIEQQRREMTRLLSGLETVVTDLDASLDVLPRDEIMTLTEDTVARDEQLRTAG